MDEITRAVATALHDDDCKCGAYEPEREPEGWYVRKARVAVTTMGDALLALMKT